MDLFLSGDIPHGRLRSRTQHIKHRMQRGTRIEWKKKEESPEEALQQTIIYTQKKNGRHIFVLVGSKVYCTSFQLRKKKKGNDSIQHAKNSKSDAFPMVVHTHNKKEIAVAKGRTFQDERYAGKTKVDGHDDFR